MLRRSFLIPLAVLAAGLVALPACKKKTPEGGGGGGGDSPAPTNPPAAVKTDSVAFVQLNVKQLRESPLLGEIKGALTKAGAGVTWDELEGKLGDEIGFKPTDIDTVTGVLVDVPKDEKAKAVLIVTASKPIPKGGAFGIKPGTQPDGRGLYRVTDRAVAHFPDEKTFVLLVNDVADQYLAGYGKNRTGWPLTPELTRAAASNTLYVHVQMDKLPSDTFKADMRNQFGDLLSVKALTLQANLRGKELTVTGRAAFPDAATATKAHAKAREFVKMATESIGEVLNDKTALAEMGSVVQVVKEADQTLKGAKLEVAGADVTLSASFKANFDFAAVGRDMAKMMSGSAQRMTTQNNLKQLAIALHNYHNQYGTFPTDIVDLKTGRPLLSWRVKILPFIEQDNLFRQFKLNEPWDSPNNKPLSQAVIKTFLHPNVALPAKAEFGLTNYRGISGPGTIFDPAVRNGVRINDITDGTSNTIMLIETGELVPWAKPGDFVINPKGPLPRIVPVAGQPAANVALGDGSVRALRPNTPEQTLRALFSRNGGEVVTDW